MRGGEQELLDGLIVGAAGEDAPAGFVDTRSAPGRKDRGARERTVAKTSSEGSTPASRTGDGRGWSRSSGRRRIRGRSGPGRRPGWRRRFEAGEGGGDGFEEEGPRAFLDGLFAARGAPPWTAAIRSARQSLEQVRRDGGLPAVEGRGNGALLVHLAGARGAPIEVLLYAVFLVGGQLTVKVKRNQLRYRIASHTKSPNTERIFCVARKRQFLAASSVVPNISPIFRKRSP